jgi:hypothetical protein
VIVASAAGSAPGTATSGATGSTAGQIWVVGAGCSRSDSDVLARQRLPG